MHTLVIVRGVDLVTWASDVAGRLLAEPLPRRWAHTCGVAAAAWSLEPVLGPDTDLVVAAAWLHDIGYAPNVVVTGFHPLDGARHLRDVEHAAMPLCRLVAHHTYARIEAAERGLVDELNSEFPADAPTGSAGASATGVHLADALTYCDVTTSPDGDQVLVEDRLAEIYARYGPGHLVTRSITTAEPRIMATVSRVERALTQAQMVDDGHRPRSGGNGA